MKEKENINNIDTKERLKEYLVTLKYNKAIVDNKDIYKSKIVSESTFSRALNGNPSYLTDSFINKLFKKYGDYGFTVEYILNGDLSQKNSKNVLLEKEIIEKLDNENEENDQFNILKIEINKLKKTIELLKDRDKMYFEAILAKLDIGLGGTDSGVIKKPNKQI